MADLVSELNSLDFSAYIGGPMQAAIEAQNSASMAQVNFISSVGFNEQNEINYVTFKYKKGVNTIEESTTEVDKKEVVIEYDTYELDVPLLTILNIPSLRIDEMTIDFNAKLTSVENKTVESSLDVSTTMGAGIKIVNFKASAAYKRKTTSNTEVQRSYDMAVHVRVVNDDLPAGLDRILSMLESQIIDKEVTTKSTTTPVTITNNTPES